MRGLRQRILEHFDDIGRKRLPVADYLEPDVIGDEFGQVRFDELAHQVHQVVDLFFRTLPVLAAEGVERQTLDRGVLQAAHELAHRLHALPVAHHPRQVLALRPAAVAIHDDGDVAGGLFGRGHRAIRSHRAKAGRIGALACPNGPGPRQAGTARLTSSGFPGPSSRPPRRFRRRACRSVSGPRPPNACARLRRFPSSSRRP